MKLSLALLAAFAVLGRYEVHSVPILSRGLPEDLKDFLDIIPVEEIQDLFFDYLGQDEEFGEALDYVLSDDFKSLLVNVEAMPEVKSLLTYLHQSGLDVYELINKVHDFLGMDHVYPRKLQKITGGVSGFIKDVEALLPMEKIQKLYEEKLRTSEEFAALVNKLKSPEIQGLVDRLMSNPEIQKLINMAESEGIDVQAIFDLLSTILGLKFPNRPTLSLTKSLKDDFEDFLRLVPGYDIRNMFFEYLATDGDFAEALDYAMSEEFRQLMVDIESMPEFKDFINFLEELGVDAYKGIDILNGLLGIGHISPKSKYEARKITGGFSGFIKDMKALLPMDKIGAFYKEKLETSEDFAKLVNKLKSKEFQGFIDKIMAHQTVQYIIEEIEAKGVDLQEISNVITGILGSKSLEQKTFLASKSLQDDLNDFLNIVPTERIEQIFYQYLAEDEKFGEAVDYILSEEFRNLIAEVESMSEIKGLLDFLQESGVEAYKAVNIVNDLLGIDRIHPLYNFKFIRITGGLNGFLKDVMAVLPLKEIEDMYQLKLETSESFATLVKRLQSQEFQNLADRLMSHPTVIDLIKKAEEGGVDVQAILDILTSILGLKFPQRPVLFLARNLKDDLDELLALVPMDELQALFYEYLEVDEDFGEALDYVLSTEFTGLVVEVEGLPEVNSLFDFLVASGLDVYGFINKINDFLGIDRVVVARYMKNRKITGGLQGFLDDAKALLPLEKIEALYNEKLQTSEDLKTLVNRLKSPEFQALVDKLLAHPALQNLIEKAKAKGVDVQAIFDFLTTLLGLKFPGQPQLLLTRSLKDDLNDLLALVPVDELQALFYEYLENDEDFGEALDYVLSTEFTGLVTEVEGLPEVKSLLSFLQSSGLDVYGVINKMNDFLGIDHIANVRFMKNKKISGGLQGFLDDVKALLPLDKIEALYNEKLQTSEDLKTLVNHLKSSEFQALVDKLLAHPALQNLIKKAEAKGVDVQAIFDLLTTVLGLKFPARPQFVLSRSLKDDLDDLLALVPVDELQALFYEYLENDEDFGEALDYVLSTEFTGLVTEVEGLPEVKSLLSFLQASGLDVYGVINKMNDFLGIDHIANVRFMKNKKISGGLQGFLDDAKALLPLDKIEALYNEKLQTSKDLKTLVNHLKSPEFQALVDKLLAHPALQNLIKKAEAKGVDVQAIFDLLTTVLGLKFPSRPQLMLTRSLKDDLNDLMALMPVDDLRALFYKYLENDEDFGEALDYVLSDEFTKLVAEIEALPEVRSLLNFVQTSGLNIYDVINKLNEFLGIDHITPTQYFKNNKISGGLQGFLDDAKALLPLDKIEALYNEKLQTSEDFKNLVNRLKSPEFQDLSDKLQAHPTVQNLIKKAEAKGVDVQAIFDFLTTLLGIKFPPRPSMF